MGYKNYLEFLTKTVEGVFEYQNNEDGSIIGGALANKDAKELRNASMSTYLQLFKDLDDITFGYISKKDLPSDENPGIQSKDLRTASRVAAAARYYQKAVNPEDALYLEAHAKAIDSSVAKILSGKEGVAKRQATPEEKKRYIQLVYEQAHRALNNNVKLEDALQDFTTTSKESYVIAHVAALRAIFCLAWQFHQGNPAWQTVDSNIIAEPYWKYLDLKQIAEEVYDTFQEYYQFRDRYVDDQKSRGYVNKYIDWNVLEKQESQDLAWTIAKVSAESNIEFPNKNYNDHGWHLSYGMLGVPTHIEEIAPNLLAYLSQIQRGSIAHIRATRLILEQFCQTPQIYGELPSFVNAIVSLNLLDDRVGFISQSNILNVLKQYGNDADRMLSLSQGIVKFLVNTPVALRKNLSGTIIIDQFGANGTGILERMHNSKAMQVLTKDQYKTILQATFKEFNNSKDAFKNNINGAYEKFLNLLFLAPIKLSQLEAFATPVSVYYLKNDFDKEILQPILKVLEDRKDGVSPIFDVLTNLFNGATDPVVMKNNKLEANLNPYKQLPVEFIEADSLNRLN